MIVPMTTRFEFTPEIREAVNYARYHPPVPLVQRRREVWWLKSHGRPQGQIVQLVDVSENTRRDYCRLYAEGGGEKLKEVPVDRPESELHAHPTALEASLRANPPATLKEAQSEIEALIGSKRSETQGREFRKKTPAASPPSRDDPGHSRPRGTSGLPPARD